MKGSLRVHLLPVLILMCLCSTFTLAADTHYFDEVSSWEDKALSELLEAQQSHEAAVANLRKDFPSLTPAEQVERIQQILAAQDELYSKINWQYFKQVSDQSSADVALGKFKKILQDSQKEIWKLFNSGDSQSASQVLDVLAARQEAVDWIVAEEARLRKSDLYWYRKSQRLQTEEVSGFFNALGVEAQKILRKHEELKKQIEALDRDSRQTAYRDSGPRRDLEEEYRLSLRRVRIVYEASKILPEFSFRQNHEVRKLLRSFAGFTGGFAGFAVLFVNSQHQVTPGLLACGLLAGTCIFDAINSFYESQNPRVNLPGKDRSRLKKSLAGGSNLETELVLAKLTEKLLASAVCRTSGSQPPASSTQPSRVRVAPEQEVPRGKVRIGEMTEPVEVGVPESQRGVIRNER